MASIVLHRFKWASVYSDNWTPEALEVLLTERIEGTEQQVMDDTEHNTPPGCNLRCLPPFPRYEIRSKIWRK